MPGFGPSIGLGLTNAGIVFSPANLDSLHGWRDAALAPSVTARVPVADIDASLAESLTAAASSDFTFPGDFTIVGWFRTESDTGNVQTPAATGFGGSAFKLEIRNGGPVLRFIVNNAVASHVETTVALNTVFFFVAKHEDGVQTSIEVNRGGPVIKAYTDGNYAGIDRALNLGFHQGGSPERFNGLFGLFGMAHELLTESDLDTIFGNGSMQYFADFDATLQAKFKASGGTDGDLWWDMDERTGVRASASGNNNLADTNTVLAGQGTRDSIAAGLNTGIVSDLDDRSLNDDDAVQALGPEMPIYNADGIAADRPGLDYNGVDEDMVAAFTTGGAVTQPFLIAMIYRCASWGVGEFLFDGDDGVNSVAVLESAGNIVIDAGGTPRVIDTIANMQGTHVLICILDGASSRVFLDGGASKIGASPGANVLDGLTSAADNAGANNLTCTIAEDAVADALPTDATIDKLGEYLAGKAGTTWAPIS